MSWEPTIAISEVASSTHPSVSPSATEMPYLDDSLSGGTVVGDLEQLMRLKEDEERLQNQVMINTMLPDETLLEIFHFYNAHPKERLCINLTMNWIKLAHVCRRWRHIIFESPRRLDLRLVCSSTTPARSLDIWPPFPIVIASRIYETMGEERLGNIMAVLLECRERISIIEIFDLRHDSMFEKLMAAMHGPFPVLKYCALLPSVNPVLVPVLPETFLGGSAQNLKQFRLYGIPFPTFPEFILSSTQIQELALYDIPDSWHISLESMATCLATLPNLKHLSIGFQSPLSRPVQIDPSPMKCAVLPALTNLYFLGNGEYFEDFVARIDTPKLTSLTLMFFMNLIFDLPRLYNFIGPTQRAKRASMELTTREINITLWSQSRFELGILSQRQRLKWQLSSITHILSQQLRHVKHFRVLDRRSYYRIHWVFDLNMDSSQFLELFRLLISVESLFVSKTLVHRVATLLKDLTGAMVIEVLPALRNLLLAGLKPSGSVRDDLNSFVTARQLNNRPVLVQPWGH